MLTLFYQGAKRHEWTNIPTSRMECFFRSLSLIMADQLRYIVQKSAEDFVSLFDGSQIKQGESPKKLDFSIRLVLDEQQIRFEPTMPELQSAIEGILDTLFQAIDKVPRIETQLFSHGQNATGNRSLLLNAKPEQCIKVAFEATFPDWCSKIRARLRGHLTRNLQGPTNYIVEFDKFKPLVTKAAYAQVTHFLEDAPTVEQLMEVRDATYSQNQ